MQQILGTTIPVFITMTVFVMGFAAYMTGQALANTWRPVWQVVVYCVLLGLADRFLTFALFDGELLSFSGFLFDTAVLVAIGLIAFRLTHVARMVSQYPWLYERVGLWTYRRRAGPGEPS